MPRAADLVLLARLEAQLTEMPHTVLTKHIEGDLHNLWERDPRPLGRGGFGEVYREECTEGSQRGSLRAVKLIQRPNARQLRNIDLSRELEAIARFSQSQYEPYFTKCFGWYETSNTIFIAMEFLGHGDLQSCSGNPIPEREMQSIASQVLEGLYFMHSQGYAHRDLKPQNLLVYRPRPHWHIKIADFGLSKRVAESFSSLHTQAGTQGYMAPEVMGLLDDDDSDDGLTPSYTTAVDIWALGVITFYMLTGHLPFPASDLRPLKRYIRGKTSFPIQVLHDEGISDAGCTWIESCMAPSPPDRPSAGYSRRHDWPMGAKLSIPATEAFQSSIASSGIATASWTAPDSTYDSGDTQAAVDNIVTLGNTVSVEAPVHNASKEMKGSETSSSASPRSPEQPTQAHIPESASSLHTTSETPTGKSEDTVMQQHNTVDAQIPGHQYSSSLWTQHVTLSADDEVIGTICGTSRSPQRVWLCLWSADTGKLMLNQSLALQASHIRDRSTLGSFAIGPGALVVALLTDDARIHVWSLAHNGTQHQSPPMSVHVAPSYLSQRDFLQFSRDGKFLVHHGKMTSVFDPRSMSLVRTVDLDLDNSSHGTQMITPDSQSLAYSPPARDGTDCGGPHLWSIKTGRHREKNFHCPKNHKGPNLTSQAFKSGSQRPLLSLDGRRMCTISSSCGLHLWDLNSGDVLLDDDLSARSSTSWTRGMYEPALSNDGRLFAGVKMLDCNQSRSPAQLELTIFNVETAVRAAHLFPVELLCKRLSFHPNGSLIFVGWYQNSRLRPSGSEFIRTLMLGDEQVNVKIFIMQTSSGYDTETSRHTTL